MKNFEGLFYEFPIYGMTAEALSYSKDNIKDVRDMLDSGIKIIQYREKEKSFKEMFEQALEIRKMTLDYGALFIIDDFLGLALAVHADGVHIGQDDLPIRAVREVVGNDFIIGSSTHSPKQAEHSQSMSADYIGVGPIYTTHTKKDVCAPVGLSYLDYAVKNIDIPFVAIGGIKENNIDEIFETGARSACLVSGIVGSPDIKAAVKRLKTIYDESLHV